MTDRKKQRRREIYRQKKKLNIMSYRQIRFEDTKKETEKKIEKDLQIDRKRN